MESTPITCMMSATLIRATKHANYNNKHKQQQQKHSRDNTCTMRHAHNNCWTSNESSCLAEPVTMSSVTKKQAQARQQKVPFCWYSSKNK
jgi:hypothetical protein